MNSKVILANTLLNAIIKPHKVDKGGFAAHASNVIVRKYCVILGEVTTLGLLHVHMTSALTYLTYKMVTSRKLKT